MPLILYECALHRFRHRPPNWISLIKVIFKFTLALKQWLVCTISSATILLHLRTHSSKNYSLIFLHVFIPIFSILSPTNTPRMKNQFVVTTLRFLHFIRTIHPIFPKYFFFIIFSMQLERRTTRGRARGPRRPRSRPRRRVPPTAAAFPGLSRQETVGATADG